MKSSFIKIIIKLLPLLIATPLFAFQPNFNESGYKKVYNDPQIRAFNPFEPTPSRLFKAEISKPEKFATTNNLAKKPGSFYRAFGEVIFVKGKVSDSFGVPISDAVIEIWQANASGKYHSLLDKESEFIDPYFSMSGTSISDNLGQYSFITVMPGSQIGRAPHINVNIFHERFGTLETEIYFQDHPYNQTDYQYLSYKENERKALTCKVERMILLDPNSIKVCTFNITMQGIHKYKKF